VKPQAALPNPGPVLQPPTPDQWIQAQTFVNAVWVPIVQNIGGAVGVFVMVLIGLWQVMQVDFTPAARAAAVIAAIVFGIFMVVRSFRDEVRFLVSVWAERHDKATQVQLQAEVKRLADEIVRLKTEAIPATRYEREMDAQQLLWSYYKSGFKLDRRSVMERGQLSRPRWERATDMLRKAGVIDERGNVKTHTYAAAWSMVVRFTAESTSYTRTADGDWAKN
jgi:hypothetical protein